MSSYQKPLRVARLGAGYFSRFHYEAWRRIDAAELVGACDRDAGKAAMTGAPVFGDLAEMLDRTRPDLLDIIVPPPGHLGSIRTAIEAGVRAIICQKPFCQSEAEAVRAADLAHEAGAMLVVHENFRFQPWYRIIRSAMTEGRLGNVHQVSFRLRPGDGQGPRAYLDRQPYFQGMPRFLVHETAVHFIDTFAFLLGEPEAVFADLRKHNPVIAGEDAGHILFWFSDGRRALFDGNRHLDHVAHNQRLTMGEALVEGTAGSITLDGFGEVRLRKSGENGAEILLEAQDWPGFGGDCVFALQNHVVEALLSGTQPENTAREYLKVIAAEQAIYRSAETGCRVTI